MTGMKEGAGEDPFAESDDSESSTRGDDTAQSSDDTRETASRDTTSGGSESQTMQIPYKFRRDGVQDGRDRVPLFLQPETKSKERDALREMEDRFGDDVSLTDLREAVVKAGLNNLDEVETNLRGWGYGVTFED